MRLYSKAKTEPAKPVIGQRVGNMFQGIWGTNGSETIPTGSPTTTYGSKILTSFDTITEQSMLNDALALQPVAAIPSGNGQGVDFNILTAGKKYTVGCGMLQNQSNTIYLGFSSGSTGRYFYSSSLPKNEFSYHVFKAIPSGQSEIYPNESGRFNSSFNRVGSAQSPITNTDITRIRMLMGYTAASGTERWDKTIAMFFRPFCYEGETWFDFRVQPWKNGNTTYRCDVEYDTSTMKITSVGKVINDAIVYYHDKIYVSNVNTLINNLIAERQRRGMPIPSESTIAKNSEACVNNYSYLLDELATKDNSFIKYAGTFPKYYTSGTASQGVSTSGKTLVTNGSKILADHFNTISQIYMDIKDDMRCSAGCMGSCYSSCTGTTCSTACSNGCATGCSNSCYTNCSGSCATGCSNTCTSGCTGGCRGGIFKVCSCGGNCDTTCGKNCSGKCSNGCSASCWSACKTNCGTGCTNACTATCTNLCTTGCKLSAYSMAGRVPGSEIDEN